MAPADRTVRSLSSSASPADTGTGQDKRPAVPDELDSAWHMARRRGPGSVDYSRLPLSPAATVRRDGTPGRRCARERPDLSTQRGTERWTPDAPRYPIRE